MQVTRCLCFLSSLGKIVTWPCFVSFYPGSEAPLSGLVSCQTVRLLQESDRALLNTRGGSILFLVQRTACPQGLFLGRSFRPHHFMTLQTRWWQQPPPAHGAIKWGCRRPETWATGMGEGTLWAQGLSKTGLQKLPWDHCPSHFFSPCDAYLEVNAND